MIVLIKGLSAFLKSNRSLNYYCIIKIITNPPICLVSLQDSDKATNYRIKWSSILQPSHTESPAAWREIHVFFESRVKAVQAATSSTKHRGAWQAKTRAEKTKHLYEDEQIGFIISELLSSGFWRVQRGFSDEINLKL